MATTTETSRHGLERPDEAQPAAAGAAIADPGALGLAAFATTTFVLSFFNAGLLPTALEAVVLPLALFYGGIAQFFAGMWEFRKGNTFGATAFGSYGTFWMSFAAYVEFVVPELGGTSKAASATGLFLLAWTIFTAIMLVASLRTNGAIIAVFVTLFVTLVLLTLADLAGASGLGTIGGYTGILTALVAWYAAGAVVTNATWGRTVLPVAPRA
jgi:succinate-acetate transporter protein